MRKKRVASVAKSVIKTKKRGDRRRRKRSRSAGQAVQNFVDAAD